MNNSNMFIIDCETTGLLRNSLLLEFGGVIVNNNLEILEEFEIVINRSEKELIDNCSDKVLEMHRSSGLYDKVINSKITLEQSKIMFLEIINKYNKTENKPILTNNTVRMDYMWLEETFKEDFVSLFDYRTIDISSINELVKRFKPELLNNKVNKKLNHTALSDAKETLEELKLYKNLLF